MDVINRPSMERTSYPSGDLTIQCRNIGEDGMGWLHAVQGSTMTGSSLQSF